MSKIPPAPFFARDKVKDYMHVEGFLEKKGQAVAEATEERLPHTAERQISLEEIERIINKTFYANQGKKSIWKRRVAAAGRHHEPASERNYEPAAFTVMQKETREEYLLVDGYNIIYAWPELSELADENMDSARMKLLDSLSNYQWIQQCRIIVVFDAYRVQGHREEVIDYHDVHIVYTREAQTADQYIEKFAHDNKKKYNIVVATSDGLQQMIVRGAGCALLSARELKAAIEEANERLRKEFAEMQTENRTLLIDALPPELKQQMDILSKE